MRYKSAEREQWWREQIERQESSGLGLRAWCEREGIAKSAFYRWRDRIADPSRDCQTQAKADVVPRRPVFLPVRVRDEPVARVDSGVEVLLSKGIRVAVRCDFDAQTLRRVVEVLEQC